MRMGRLGAPFNAFALKLLVPAGETDDIAGELNRIAGLGASPAFIAEVLEMLAADRADAAKRRDHIELVWTGPSLAGETSRDTGVVVREMFKSAQKSVLVAGFAVYQGKEIFRVLAERMEQVPELAVKMFLNVGRDGLDDVRPAGEILADFADDFRSRQWPGNRLPELFYDPRSLDVGGGMRASMHAKCMVIDDEEVLVTSANFTEAAQMRNIEAGLRVRDAALAKQLAGHFERLAEADIALPLTSARR
jgi:phosphatidylserine/phosphatidylglycerophosphate/cardiolipin synthase-like enzyme